MRCIKIGAVVVAIVAAAVFLYDCFGIAWVGAFPLTVTLQPAGPGNIARDWAGAVYRREYAEEELRYVGRNSALKPVADFRQPFKVEVVCSGSTSGLGRERSYSYYHVLALRVEYADGHWESKVVDIPDGRTSREITVSIP